jgi:hypothetical protein
MKRHMLICLFRFMLVNKERGWNSYKDFVKYSLGTKWYSILRNPKIKTLPSCYYSQISSHCFSASTIMGLKFSLGLIVIGLSDLQYGPSAIFTKRVDLSSYYWISKLSMSTHPIIFKTPKRIQRTYTPKQKTNKKNHFKRQQVPYLTLYLKTLWIQQNCRPRILIVRKFTHLSIIQRSSTGEPRSKGYVITTFVIFSHGNSHLLTLHAGERKISNIRTQSHTKIQREL